MGELRNLSACIEEVREAALKYEPGPPDPADYQELRQRLAACRGKLPPLYRQAVFDPFDRALVELGPGGKKQLLFF